MYDRSTMLTIKATISWSLVNSPASLFLSLNVRETHSTSFKSVLNKMTKTLSNRCLNNFIGDVVSSKTHLYKYLLSNFSACYFCLIKPTHFHFINSMFIYYCKHMITVLFYNKLFCNKIFYRQ